LVALSAPMTINTAPPRSRMRPKVFFIAGGGSGSVDERFCTDRPTISLGVRKMPQTASLLREISMEPFPGVATDFKNVGGGALTRMESDREAGPHSDYALQGEGTPPTFFRLREYRLWHRTLLDGF
jgi:hypothetical protein